jgi:hypothetical protein
MDPYLEAHWRDVHSRLVLYSADALQPRLPGDLRARVEERVVVESPLGAEHSVYPDVRVVEHPRRRVPPAEEVAPSGVAVADPIVIACPEEVVTEGFIEIREAGTGGRVITVIEFLSLTNKLPGDGQKDYVRKQKELAAGRTSLVEVDLLRAGRRVLMVPHGSIPPQHRTTYQVCVHRAWRTGYVEVYRAPLRERLPAIRIPLRETDADVVLDIQDAVDRAYENGAYDDTDYRAALDPPLDPDDAAWTDALLRERGLR